MSTNISLLPESPNADLLATTDALLAGKPDAGADEPSGDEQVVAPTFAALNLHPELQLSLDDLGYVTPTPVQFAVFGPVSAGKDLMVQSRTGTGKTTAFGLPIINAVHTDLTGVQSLVLAPTRELAIQVAKELGYLGKHRGVRVEAIYGGAPIGKQISALQEGVHIVVGTPGRVLDHLARKTLDVSHLRTFVLDECDEMLSMGFFEDIERITKQLPKQHQTLLFSATMPDEVGRYAKRYMTKPETISLSGDNVGVANITHQYYVVSGIARMRDLLKILFKENPESAIIFCNMRDETTAVARFLRKQGLDAEAISSDLSQADRERVMERMRQHNLRFLVATDVAARGIDISNLSLVVNYAFPDAPDIYVHRTGRTGRAGKHGTAVSLVGPKELGSFWYLKLQHKIKPQELILPPDSILEGKLPAPLPPIYAQPRDAMSALRRALVGEPTAEHRTVAQRILTDGDDLL